MGDEGLETLIRRHENSLQQAQYVWLDFLICCPGCRTGVVLFWGHEDGLERYLVIKNLAVGASEEVCFGIWK
jgi:hypothetical protein